MTVYFAFGIAIIIGIVEQYIILCISIILDRN